MKPSSWLSVVTLLALVAPVALSLPLATPPLPDPPSETFEREIRPLLVERCQSCHGEKENRGGLRLTSGALLLKGGAHGPVVVPGKPDESRLIQAIEYRSDLKMPPTGRLSAAEIGRLRRWVALGAVWPEAPAGAPTPATGAFAVSLPQRRWWAFQPVRPVSPPPAPKGTSPIDAFVRAELATHGLKPAPRADRRTLIRRATFDLTGLPPTPEEVEAFVNDRSLGAWAKVVDRLLASPAYGERWGRQWLDVVRYADYHDGNPAARTASCEPLQAWRYRDWVVKALNQDLPYDQFVTHQIAGDTLPSPDGQEFYADGLIASTFLTDGSWDRGDADKEKMVSDMVDDQIDTVGKAFLGLTLGCARCHNHKFDPVSQNDYYALAGIFYSTHILKDIGAKGGEYTLNRIPLASREYVERRERQLQRLNELSGKLAELDRKTPKPPADDPSRTMLASERDQTQKELLPEPPLAEAAQEGGTAGGLFPKIQDVPVHIRGSYTRLGAVVPRRMPEFFVGEKQPPIVSGSGRRELAQWITSPSNPLTARVLVNRIWQGHFGEGLVRTPNNFGLTSQPPSHPALLDWLAARFSSGVPGSKFQVPSSGPSDRGDKGDPVDGSTNLVPLKAPMGKPRVAQLGTGNLELGTTRPWSLKSLHRLILLSETYQQSSRVPRAEVAKDPENRWLGRFVPRRLEAEAIRDGMLAVSGGLDRTLGGPAAADLGIARRSLYVQTARWDRGSFATLFDAANPDASVEKRTVSTVAPQALFLLNHEFPLGQAKRLAERLAREVPGDDTARLQHAYRLLFARAPTAEELRLDLQFLTRARKNGAEAAWTDLAHVLLCSNEFVFLD